MLRHAFATIGAALAAGGALAGDAGIERKIFDRMDVPAGYEAVVGSADLPDGMSIGRHTHAGVEFAYVVSGEVEFLIEGREPVRVKAGGFMKIDSGKIHDAKALGGPGKVVATWVVEKGKPLASPAK
ncbi:MAG: cupin domain-containing protein [Rhodospirillaceae bacterium]